MITAGKSIVILTGDPAHNTEEYYHLLIDWKQFIKLYNRTITGGNTMQNNFHWYNKKCNSTLLNGIESIAFTDRQIAHFTDTITHEKNTVELTNEIYDNGHIEVFNEIFPLSAFGL